MAKNLIFKSKYISHLFAFSKPDGLQMKMLKKSVLEFPWILKARVFVPGKSFQPSLKYLSSLLGLFLRYKGNEVL